MHKPINPSKPPRHQVDPALYADADGVVQYAVPCAFCSYNLQTLRLGSNCPECGKAVGFRFVPELLQNAPVEWLRRVRLGLNLYFLTLLLSFLIMGGIWVWVIVNEMPKLSTGVGAPPAGPPEIMNSTGFHAFGLVNWVVFTALSLCATWLFTSPHPSAANQDWPISRVTLRYCVAIPAILFPIWSGVAYLLGLSTAQPTPALPPVYFLVAPFFFLPWLIGFVAWWRYVASLLERIPSRRMSRLSQLLAWLNVGMFTPHLLIGLILFLQPIPMPPPPPYAMSGGIAPPTSQAATNPVIPPTSQWIYVTATNSSQLVTTIPAGTPIFTPAMPSRAFMTVGCFSAPLMCCGMPLFFVGAVVTLIQLARSLASVHAIAREQHRLAQQRPAF